MNLSIVNGEGNRVLASIFLKDTKVYIQYTSHSKS